MEKEKKAIIFNIVLALATVFLLITGPLYVVENLTFVMVQVFGILLILWALLSRNMNRTHTHKLPPGYFWVSKGPYEIIRHPIYAGFLLILSSMVQYNFEIIRITLFLLIIAIIFLKIIREEDTMQKEITEYGEYMLKTKRIIPYLF